ncbi:uncharacterized protein BX664DRAFT_388105 [Halteromyces radiatus]|uniref:uncharacterized protein n=1 Tax=Halteromyces radiatus TaxID=101107 RepID=UPI00222118AD|nr:uncharacterized protein BX664DRAFT_388105 [Halteromyces radiatus]KAI8082989.1 hypothetical protein BX664DRAFT_388105 [Halteromyces radiatus]
MHTKPCDINDTETCCSLATGHSSDQQAATSCSLYPHHESSNSYHHHHHPHASCISHSHSSDDISRRSTSSYCCQCDHHQKSSSSSSHCDENQASCSISTNNTKKHDDEEKKLQRKSRGQMEVVNEPIKRFADDNIPLGGHDTTKRRRRKRKCAIARGMIYCVFVMIILGGIATFFCWPRTPMVVIGSHAERQNPQEGTIWATTPDKRPWMEATWLMNVTLDNRDNWIPTRLNKMEMIMMDSLTQSSFATATMDDLALAPKSLVVIPNIVFHVHYSAATDTDTTWQDLYRTCGPQQKQGPDMPSLNINIKITFHFQGILWSSTVTASPPSGGFVCPL